MKLFESLGLETRGMITAEREHAFAVTSSDNRYRYLLGRLWCDYEPNSEFSATLPLWVFGMLNPSNARHDVDDPTVRKCRGFAKRGGAGGFLIVNMFGYSTPYPDALVAAHLSGVDVFGPQNVAVLDWALSRPAMLWLNIAAWGGIPNRLKKLSAATRLRFSGQHCLGTTKDGEPRHPLMLPYAAKLERWRIAA